MMRFQHQGDSFELGVTTIGRQQAPADKDAYVTIRIVSAGFSGKSNLWVDGRILQSFCADLLEMEKVRRGEARLQGVSPGELSVTVRSVDGAGHMVVEGSAGFQIQRDHCLCWHSVAFGIEFDPSQLHDLVAIPWVRQLGHRSDPDDS